MLYADKFLVQQKKEGSLYMVFGNSHYEQALEFYLGLIFSFLPIVS